MSAELGKDVFREILMRMDDKTLLKTCKIDRGTYHDVCDDQFFHRRLQQKYPDTLLVKPDYMNYRQYFLDVVYHVAKLKEDFNYEYKSGNLYLQNYAFKVFTHNKNIDLGSFLLYNARQGQLPLVEYAIEQGADPHIWNDEPFALATENGHLDVVKYLVNLGANVHLYDNKVIDRAELNGHHEVAKYLRSLP